MPNVTTTPPLLCWSSSENVPAGDIPNKHPSHPADPQIKGLRAHDERVIEQLVLRREHTGRGVAEDVLAADPEYVREWGQEQGPAEEEAADEEVPESGGLLKFSTPRDPATIARFLRTRVLQPDSEVWLTGYQHLYRWVEQHGHAQVPVEARVPVAGGAEHDSGGPKRVSSRRSRPEEGGETYALGQWLAEQRRAHREGVLRPWRFELLDELGLQWDVHDARFAEKLAVFRRYFDIHGTLAAPPGAVFEGHPVGQDLANLRKPAGLGKKPERAAERRARLEAIDADWNPAWPVPWQRRWAKVQMCLEGGAALEDLLPGVVVDGDDIGAWLLEQRTSWKALSVAQRGRLEALGMPAPEDAPGGGEGAAEGTAAGGGMVMVPASASTWERGIAALRQYQAREGHVRVPRRHVEMILVDEGSGGGVVQTPHRLGVFRSNTRSRREGLSAKQRHEAEQLGLLA